MKLSEFAGAEPLTGRAALVAVSALIAVAFMGSTIVTPLYIMYEQTFGFSKIMLTLIYATYVLGNLGALFFFGRLSDQVGRRRAALPALALVALGGLCFLLARGTAELFAARILTGLAVAIASGTGTAWLAELFGEKHRPLAATVATSVNFLGLAAGPLLAGILADVAPWPLHLPFVVYLALVAVTAALVWRTHETVARPVPFARIAVAPRFGVPQEIRSRFVAPAVTGFGAMALIGFYAALAPSILAESLHQTSHMVAGVIVCLLMLAAAAAIVVTRRVESYTGMLWALGLMIPAVALVVAAQAAQSILLMLAATLACGVASGIGYRSTVQVINEIAPADRRAEVLSAYFICCFTGNALPVIGVGVITVFAGSIVASLTFAAMIALFALVALGFGLKYRA